MGFELTKGQKKGIKKAKKWFKHQDDQLFEIEGPAGTGKSTLAFSLINEMGLDPIEEVMYMTYVGKATLPLRQQGLPARTIHSSLYYRTFEKVLGPDGKPLKKENGKPVKKPVFKLVKSIPKSIKLILVDEGPMVPSHMCKDILSFGVPTMVLGDRGQLPPIFGESLFLQNPDVSLDEIVRQKEGDPIIYLSYLARTGQDIPLGKYGDRCFVVDTDLLRYPKIYTKPDMVLCGKNKTRENINNTVRYNIKHYDTEIPQFGEKLVCRKNNWDIEIDDIALINGLFGNVINTYEDSFNGRSLNIDFKPECLNDWYEDVSLDYEYLTMDYKDRKNYGMYTNGNLFEYGYASTVHLAQGSQYGYVIFIEEVMGNAKFQKRFNYTGITRAKNTLVMVRPKQRRDQSFFF